MRSWEFKGPEDVAVDNTQHRQPFSHIGAPRGAARTASLAAPQHHCGRCRSCVVPLEEDVDLFDGRKFCNPNPESHRSRSSWQQRLSPSLASGNEERPPVGSDSYERRDIVAQGMQRFEGIAKTAPPQPDFERLSPRVVCVLGMNPTPYTLNGTNCYLVGTGKRRILIDTGEYPEFDEKSAERSLQFVANLQRVLKDEGDCSLEMILLTHMHTDHWGGVFNLLHAFPGTPVAMLPAPDWTLSLFTVANLKRTGQDADVQMAPPPFDADSNFSNSVNSDEYGASLRPWKDEDISWDIFFRTKAEIVRDYYWSKFDWIFYSDWAGFDGRSSDVVPGVRLTHGDVIRTEGATLRAMYTPGHCENHCMFVLEEEKSVFSGDHVLGFGTTLFGDLYEYMASLEALRRYHPLRLYPGHGPYIADGDGLITRYLEHRQAREVQVVNLLAMCARRGEGALTAMQIARLLYTDTEERRMKQAKENVERILRKLWREGKLDSFTDATRTAMADIPLHGYVERLPHEFVWQWSSSGRGNGSSSGDAQSEFEELVTYIAAAADSSLGGTAAGKSCM